MALDCQSTYKYKYYSIEFKTVNQNYFSPNCSVFRLHLAHHADCSHLKRKLNNIILRNQQYHDFVIN